MAYYTRQKSMWDELGSYSKVSYCTCGVAHKFLREREEEKLHQFLMGLDDAVFGTVRSQLLNMDPLPPVNKAYAMVSKEERHRSIVRGQEERLEVMAMMVNTAAKGRETGQSWTKQRGGAERNCSHCNKKGHDVADCFELHGYPTWYKGRKGREHVEQSRGRGQAGRGQAFAVTTGGLVESSSRSSIPGLSTEQFQKLLSMLDRSGDGTDKLSSKDSEFLTWILDSGASNHMTGKKEYLSDLKETIPMPVYLPSGAKTMATMVGSVILSPEMVLTDVLYVLYLTCNLISIRQLISVLNCQVTFTNELYIIHDRTSKTLIGAGELSGGYYYKALQAHSVIQRKQHDSNLIWHR